MVSVIGLPVRQLWPLARWTLTSLTPKTLPKTEIQRLLPRQKGQMHMLGSYGPLLLACGSDISENLPEQHPDAKLALYWKYF